MTYEYKNETIDYTILYRKQKTMGIYIDIYGNIELRVPKNTSMEHINFLLENNWEQIQLKSREQKEKISGIKEKEYYSGETFLYLGKNYPIQITIDKTIAKDHVLLEENSLHIYVREQEEDRIKQTLKRFYYQKCKRLVEKRIRFYENNFKTKPRSIQISDNSSAWGTCNSKFQLTFHWKLAMAPLESIDYVVVHELCHMVHLNHDRSFWRLVGKILPDYKQRKEWLDQSNWKMVI